MTESGESSIRNYECGSPPLIDLYHALVETEGVHGARFSGAGFRGCCVALVEPRAIERVANRVGAAYARRHPDLAEHASIVLCDTNDGAAIIDDAHCAHGASIHDELPVQRPA
jgi:galactokinase/galacturonokinase